MNVNISPDSMKFNAAAGLIEHRVQFASELDLESMPDQSIMIPMNSATADRAYVHFRQNVNNATDGMCFVEQIIIRDVTESLKSASSASASARSAMTATTQAGLAGDSAASASMTLRLIAAAGSAITHGSGPVSNPGFETGDVDDHGAPYGWLFEASDVLEAVNALAVENVVDPMSAFGSKKSYGQSTILAGNAVRWWRIGKRFETVQNQRWRVGYKIWADSNGGDPSGDGFDFVGANDAFVSYEFFDSTGARILPIMTSATAAWQYNDDNPGMNLARRWFFHNPDERITPSTAAYVEIWINVVSANSETVPNRIDYETYTDGNALVLLDDVDITSSNGSIFEISLSTALAEEYAESASESASAALASQNAAGVSASASAGSATDASGYAGQALTSRNQASNFATSAGMSATSAADSAMVATNAVTGIDASTVNFQAILKDATDFIAVGQGSVITQGGPALGQANTVLLATAAPMPSTGLVGANVVVPIDQALQFGGQRIRIDILARQPVAGEGIMPSPDFAAIYRAREGESSVKNTFTHTNNDWNWHHFYYDVPRPNAGGIDWVELWGDNSQSGKQTQFSRIIIRLLTSEEDLPNFGSTQASVTSLLGAHSDSDGFSNAFIGLTAVAEGSNAKPQIAGIRAAAYVNPDGSGDANLELLGDVIVPGSLSAEKLTVGLGRNLLSNTDFSDGDAGWQYNSSGTFGDQTNSAIRPPGQVGSGTFFPVLEIHQNGTATGGAVDVRYRPEIIEGTLSVGVPIKPLQWLEASAKIATRNCTANLEIDWFNQMGEFRGRTAFGQIANDTGVSGNPSAWPVAGGRAQAPDDAAYATWVVFKQATIHPNERNESNSTVLIHEPQMAFTHADAVGLSSFSPGGTTLISGDKLATGSITAEKIVANAITTEKIRAGTITAESGILANLAVDTLQIKDRAVTNPLFTSEIRRIDLSRSGSVVNNITSLEIQREANLQTAISFSAQVDGFGSGTVVFTLFRGNQRVSGVSYHIRITDGHRISVGFNEVDMNPGTDYVNYNIRANVIAGPNEFDRRSAIAARILSTFFSIIQFKK